MCVVEKGAEVGAHILSGNVFEPRALDELIPDWKEKGAPLDTPVTEDAFLLLSKDKSLRLPTALLPPQQHNDGNYVISLSQLVRWLAEQAEELGVEIYPGFAAADVLYDEQGAVAGVVTRDVGIAKDGSKKSNFQPGMELRAKQTLFAEGARGSCSEVGRWGCWFGGWVGLVWGGFVYYYGRPNLTLILSPPSLLQELMRKFNLRAQSDVQTYGLGIKEVWEVPEKNHKPGWVTPSTAQHILFCGRLLPSKVKIRRLTVYPLPTPHTASSCTRSAGPCRRALWTRPSAAPSSTT